MTLHSIYNTIAKTACLMLAVFAFVPAMAQDTMQLGYCQNRAVTYMAVANQGTGGSALYLPATTMQAYRGCEITELCVSVPYAIESSVVRVFVTHGLDEAPLYEQTLTGPSRNWNTIVLDTPFAIDGSALYIGYEVTGQALLSYCNAFIDGQEWICQGDGVWQEYTGIYSAAFYATVAGDSLPRNSIRLGNVTMPSYAVTGESVAFSGEFVNLGFDPVTSLTVSYTADGQPMGEETVEVQSTASRARGTFALQGFSFGESGTRAVQLSVTAVNGSPDADPSDNTSRTKDVVCVDEFVQRNALLEFFSTENCTSCPGVHSSIDPVIDGMERIIEIGHHAGYYTDRFTIAASTAYEWYYGDGRLYAPAMMLDRSNFADNLPDIYTADCPMIGVNTYQLTSAYNEALAVPAYAVVSVEATADDQQRRAELTVSGRQLMAMQGADSLRLFVFVTEDSIYTTTQAGASTGFYHRHSARQSVTPTWGEPVDVAGGFERTYSVDIPEEWDISRLSAVAFVANYDAANWNNCRVLNAAQTPLPFDGATGIADMATDELISAPTYNGQCIITPHGHHGITICDMGGAQRMSIAQGGTLTHIGHLPHGMYVARVRTDSGVHTMKIVVGE